MRKKNSFKISMLKRSVKLNVRATNRRILGTNPVFDKFTISFAFAICLLVCLKFVLSLVCYHFYKWFEKRDAKNTDDHPNVSPYLSIINYVVSSFPLVI